MSRRPISVPAEQAEEGLRHQYVLAPYIVEIARRAAAYPPMVFVAAPQVSPRS